MTEVFDLDADIQLGSNTLPDWRKVKEEDVDVDDEELEETPADVVLMLGFDPKELFDKE